MNTTTFCNRHAESWMSRLSCLHSCHYSLTNIRDSGMYRRGLVNLWHSCPKWHTERFSWRTAFTTVPFSFYFFCPTGVCIMRSVFVCIHISGCVETVYELPLLTNNTAGEIFLHKSGAVRSVDWIFIIGASAWRWLSEYVILDKMFYCLLFKREATEVPVISNFSSLSHSLRKPALEI
jgi:hypothetical protein